MKTNYAKLTMLLICNAVILATNLFSQSSGDLCPDIYENEYLAGPHKVYYVGNEVENCTTTYTYCVQGVAGNAISHWGFALDEIAYPCLDNEDYNGSISFAGCQGTNYQQDGSTGEEVIKFDCGVNNGDCDCFTLEVPGVWETAANSMNILVKYGNQYVLIPVAGPSCEEACTDLTQFSCDDGDPCTVNDVLSKNCSGTICIPCQGTPDLPDPPSVSDFDVCYESSTTIDPSGCDEIGSEIHWYSDADLSDLLHTGSNFNTPNLTETTHYYLTCVNNIGCESEPAELTIGILDLPNIEIDGEDEICDGNSTTLTASGGVSYLWSTTETTAEITVSPTSYTTYSVTVTGTNGCTEESSISVTVNPLPNAVITGDIEICLGESTTLIASGGTNYNWSTGETTASIDVDPSSTTPYSVTVTDVNGCKANTSATVTVNPLPTPDISGDLEICNGESTTLTATGGTSYIWSTGETTESITVSPSITATYNVTVTNTYGCNANTSATVTVNPLPTPSISGDLEICDGESTTLTAAGGTSYVWDTGANTASITVSPSMTTNYNVTVTNTDGCKASTSVSVIVNLLPTAVIAGDTEICLGESTTLTATGGTSYIWNTEATTASIDVAPIETTSYSVTVTDGNNCFDVASADLTVNDLPVIEIMGNPVCDGDVLNLSVSTSYEGNFNYSWSTGDDEASISMNSYSAGEMVYVTVTDIETNCSDSDTYTIEVMDAIYPNIDGNSTICIGGSIELSVTPDNSDYTYTWSNGDTGSQITISPTMSGSISVTVSNGMGCEGMDDFAYTVNPLPDLEIVGEAVCEDETLELSVNTDSGNSIEWSTGATSSSIEISYPFDSEYSVTVTDGNYCTSSDSFTTTVYEVPAAPIVTGDITCKGTSATLEVTSSCSGTLLWYNAMDNLLQNGGTTYNIAELNENTSVYVVCESENGCPSESTEATATIIPPCNPACTYEVSCDDGDPCTEDGTKVMGSDGTECVPCTASIPIEACGEEFCTYTVGWWGNQGMITGTVSQIIDTYGVDCDGEQGLQIAGYCLTETCIDYILPGQPKHKPNKTWCGVTYDANDNMLRQIIGMTLNVYNDQNDLGNLQLSDILCSNQDILNFTSTGWTINELVSNATDCYLGVDCHGFSEGEYTGVLGSISVNFDLCQINMPCEESSYIFIPTNDVESYNEYQEAVFDKISFYPNPVLNNGRLIVLTDYQTDINLSLMDIDGNIIYHDLVNAKKGRNEIKLDVTTIKSGIYIIRVQNEIESYFTKLIIQH